VTDFPLPRSGAAVVAVPAPGAGVGFWAGSSSAALDADGSFVIAYRVRTGERGRGSNVVARSEDGERYTTVAEIGQERFGAQSLERPALVRTDEGRWRLYVCPAAPPPSKHWWIDVLEADDPAGFATAEAHTVFPGDENTGVKDPIVQRTPDGGWQAWICCHPLEVPDEEDRMTSAYATSRDGLEWEWHGTVLAPRPGTWHAHRAAHRRPPRRPRRLRRGARPRRRTGSSAPASRGSRATARASSSRSATSRSATTATSTSSRSRAAATESGTKRGSLTRATSYAPSSFKP